MRKIFAFILVIVLMMSFISCTGSTDDPSDAEKNNGTVPAGKTFYVSPDGSDENSGEKDAPLATLAGARDAIRKYRESSGLPDGGVEVIFSSGTYPVTSTVEFTAVDSGEEGKPIVFKAADSSEVIFDGGVTLKGSDFVPASDEVKSKLISEDAKAALLEIDLEKAGCYNLIDRIDYVSGWTTNNYRQELYIDNERQTVARWPNEGYEISKLTGGEDSSSISIPEDKAVLWSQAENIRYYGYPNTDWDAQNFQEDKVSVDTECSSLVISAKYDDSKVSKYFVYNVLSELDSPGEYFWDVKTKKLYYYPKEDLSDKKISFSQFDGHWITLDCSYLTFDGITFEHGRGTAIIDASLGKRISLDHITVNGCTVRSFGGYAFSLCGNNLIVTNNEIYNMGSACLFFNGGSEAESVPTASVVSNNKIHDWSQTYTVYSAAITVYGVAYTISHNEIYNSPHMGIAFNCVQSDIEYNYIHDVCTQTSDAGAIYSGARWDWSGNNIRYNLIENVIDTTFGGTPCAIYLDDELSGQNCYGNIIVNVAGTAFTIGGGRYNTVENNIMIKIAGTPINFDERGIDWQSDRTMYPNGGFWSRIMSEIQYLSDFQRFAFPINLLMIERGNTSSPKFIDDPGTPSYGKIINNITFASDAIADRIVDSADGIDIYEDEIVLDGIVWPAAPARLYGTFQSNIKYDTDPGFIDVENGKYGLKTDSRVYRDIPGFEEIPIDRIGIINTEE